MRACGVCDVGSIPTGGTFLQVPCPQCFRIAMAGGDSCREDKKMCYHFDMPFDQTDEEIIKLYKNGEEWAFRLLIDRYTSPLYNFIARFIGQDNTPDLVQETFIKAWKNLNRFKIEKASFKTWLFTIAKNTALDFLRKKKSLNFSDAGY